MNPLLVESSLKSALAASAFPTTTIYTGTDYEELTPESLNLIVSCGQLDHAAGGLYKANVTIKVVSPALLGSSSLSEMVSTLNSVRDTMTSSYLSANWPTDSSLPGFGGIWIANTKTSQADHTWVAEVDVMVGLTF
jgi:hypothetical protein